MTSMETGAASVAMRPIAVVVLARKLLPYAIDVPLAPAIIALGVAIAAT